MMTLREAKRIKIANNYPNLLGTQNAKIVKSNKSDSQYMSAIMYLAPHKVSGVVNTCPWASQGCAAACLYTAGRGRFTSVQNARIKRTEFYHKHREAFFLILEEEIRAAQRKAKRLNCALALRLNGTSDLPFEKIRPSLFTKFHDVLFYDYTKGAERAMHAASQNAKFPKNYKLTFSRSESNEIQTHAVLALGGSVAVVFDELPETYKGVPVINGDLTDERFLDPLGVVVGLKVKGDGKQDTSGFVVRTERENTP